MTDARRQRPSSPAVQNLVQQLRALGGLGAGKDRTYAALAASRSSTHQATGAAKWRPQAGPLFPHEGGRGQQHGQPPPSAYFSSRHQDLSPVDAAAAQGGRRTPPAARLSGEHVTTPDTVGLVGHSLDDEDGILFHMSGLKPVRLRLGASPPAAGAGVSPAAALHRSQSMPPQRRPTQQAPPSPPGVQRSFSFDPEHREPSAAPVPMQRTRPAGRPGSSSGATPPLVPAAATAAVAISPGSAGPAGAAAPAGDGARMHSRSSSRLASSSGSRRQSGDGARAGGPRVPGPAAHPPAWSEELLNWMLSEKAELLVQLQRAQREQQDLRREVERLRGAAASEAELVRLQAERRALLDRVQALSRAEAEASAAAERLRLENDALAGELVHSQEVCREMLAARRAARDALSEMSAQNARLVTAYVERKAEAGALRDALRRQERDAEKRLGALELQLEQARSQLAQQQQASRPGHTLPLPCSPAAVSNSPDSRAQSACASEGTDPDLEGGEEEEDMHYGAADGSEWGSPGQAIGAQPQPQAEKENAGSLGNSGYRQQEQRGTKVRWDRERSELLSLLERLQQQLSAHAGETLQPDEEADEGGADAWPGCGGTPPQAEPSDGEEGSPPAAAYDSPEERQREQWRHAHEHSKAGGRHGAANLTASFAEAAAEAAGSQHERSSSWTEGSADSAETWCSPAVTAHQMQGSPSPARPADREGAPSPPSVGRRPVAATPAPEPPRLKVPGSRTTAGPMPAASGAAPTTSQAAAARVGMVAAEPSMQEQGTVSSEQQSSVNEGACNELEQRDEWEAARRRAEGHKKAGNAAFQQRRYDQAIIEYTQGLDLLHAAAATAGAAGQEQQQDGAHGVSPPAQEAYLAAVLHCNRAAALQAMGRHLDAIADCFRAEGWEPAYPRLYQRRADAYCSLGALGPAIQDLDRCVELGGGADAAARLAEAQRRALVQPPINHYAVLGLGPTAAPAEVKAAYRRLALAYHPDKAASSRGGGRSRGGSDGGGGSAFQPGGLPHAAADAVFKLVTEAHSVLADPERRRAHDILALRHKYRRAFGAAL
eukprot:scaffold5.g1003.t1